MNLKTLISKGAIQKRVEELAEEINKEFVGEEVVVIACLKGAFMFMSDLVRHLNFPLSIDFVEVSSYSDDTSTSGEVVLKKDIITNIKNKNILLVEDILDTGLTFKYVCDYLQLREPKKIKTCLLLDNPHRRKVENIEVDYLGFVIPNEFVIGYGLDYMQKYRNLPYIGVLNQN